MFMVCTIGNARAVPRWVLVWLPQCWSYGRLGGSEAMAETELAVPGCPLSSLSWAGWFGR